MAADKKKILIIDDDKELSQIVRDMYEDYGYETGFAPDANVAWEILKDDRFHLILLDINLPQTNGFEICRELRKISTIPIIFASARISEDDKITGLDIGGDDYLPKPFSLKELLSRTNSLLRRTYGFADETQEIVIGGNTGNRIVIETGSRRVFRNGVEVNLALKEFDLLCYLAGHMGEAVQKETILKEVWGMLSEAELSTVAVHIRWLREKLEATPSSPDYIKTVWGIGYMLINGEKS